MGSATAAGVSGIPGLRGRRQMKIVVLVLVFVLVLPGLVAKIGPGGAIDIDRLSERSQVGYSVQTGGWHVGAEDPPQLYQYSLC